MNIDSIQTVVRSSSSLTVGFIQSPSDMEYLASGSTYNFPFGSSDKDRIEFSVYTTDNSKISGTVIVPTGRYTDTTSSYVDVNNNFIQYSFSKFSTDLPIVGSDKKSFVFDVASSLTQLNVQPGSYRVIINPYRIVVGTDAYNDSLKVKTISPSRTEIALSLANPKNSEVLAEYTAFQNKTMLVSEIFDTLIGGLSSPEIYQKYILASKKNPETEKSFRHHYGFKSEIDASNALSDIYYGVEKGEYRSNGIISPTRIIGIFDQFKNWLGSQYDSTASTDELKTAYYSFLVFIVDGALASINTSKPTNYSDIVSFLYDILYSDVFLPKITEIDSWYKSHFYSPLKNYLSFGPDRMYPITAIDTRSGTLIVKLSDGLPNTISEGSFSNILNLGVSDTVVQSVYFFKKSIVETTKLKGPNFSIKIETIGNSTGPQTLDELTDHDSVDELNASIENSILDSVDYTKFENFITFSSAAERLDVYAYKVNEISRSEEELADIEAKLLLHPTDVHYLKIQSDLIDYIKLIKNSFDGYERFLTNNQNWYYQHIKDVGNGETVANVFDRENGSGLANNLPEFIRSNSDSSEYVKFVNMIAHYFDNLSVYIKQFTEKNDHRNDPVSGVAKGFVEETLRSLGWEPEISKDNLSILLSSIGTDTRVSETERNRIIWKRLLNNLPFIYKTKGTSASIKAILSCFGVPTNLLQIKEFGGIEKTDNDSTRYIYDDTKFEPEFKGNGEYFTIPWQSDIQSIEFNLSFDPYFFKDEGKYVYIATTPKWNIGVIKDRGEGWGRVFFNLTNDSGTAKAMITDKVPIFDGQSYSILIRRNDVDKAYNLLNPTPSQIDLYPNRYDLIVKRSSDGRITFSTETTTLYARSYNTNFRIDSSVRFGDMVSPGTFFGTIDEIKTWTIPITTETFENHVLHKGAYEGNSSQESTTKNVFRMSFSEPINLFSNTTIVTLENLAFIGQPTYTATNFPRVSKFIGDDENCPLPSDYVDVYPYQFSERKIRQVAKLPSGGASRYKSNKVNYVTQDMFAPLSSTDRATTPTTQTESVDSNRVGVYFSPTVFQNEEIMRFFGHFSIDDLIGDPRDLSSRSYRNFERFADIYFEQGFGQIDHQTFLNIVRSYFDKSMFKYIKSMLPARAKVIEGVLIEPTLLERPKIDAKEVGRVLENIPSASIKNSGMELSGTKVSQLEDVISINDTGFSVVNDSNHIFCGDMPESFGFSVYSDNGLVFYKNSYYRADIIEKKKTYQTAKRFVTPHSELTDSDKYVDKYGRYQTIETSNYEINLAPLPLITELPMTFTQLKVTTKPMVAQFAGCISKHMTNGSINELISEDISFDGVMSGVNFNATLSGNTSIGDIYEPINVKAQFTFDGIVKLKLVGNFSDSYIFNKYYFSGTIEFDYSDPSTISTTVGSLEATFISSNGQSIFDEIYSKTKGTIFSQNLGIQYQFDISKANIPVTSKLFSGYFHTHYKYKKQLFSQKEINSYDQNNEPVKWKRGSQNKKTTVDETTGLLNNTDPVEVKST